MTAARLTHRPAIARRRLLRPSCSCWWRRRCSRRHPHSPRPLLPSCSALHRVHPTVTAQPSSAVSSSATAEKQRRRRFSDRPPDRQPLPSTDPAVNFVSTRHSPVTPVPAASVSAPPWPNMLVSTVRTAAPPPPDIAPPLPIRTFQVSPEHVVPELSTITTRKLLTLAFNEAVVIAPVIVLVLGIARAGHRPVLWWDRAVGPILSHRHLPRCLWSRTSETAAHPVCSRLYRCRHRLRRCCRTCLCRC